MKTGGLNFARAEAEGEGGGGGGAEGFWINLFKDLRDSGLYEDEYLSTECLKFCFLPILRREVHLIAQLGTRSIFNKSNDLK